VIARLRGIEGVPEDRPVACDWKTSKEIGWEYGLQLSAYLEGSREEGHDLGDDRVVLWAPREQPGAFEAKVLPRAEHVEDFGAFLAARRLWVTVEARERRQRNEWARRQRASQRVQRASIA
jgi:hypothetical protein